MPFPITTAYSSAAVVAKLMELGLQLIDKTLRNKYLFYPTDRFIQKRTKTEATMKKVSFFLCSCLKTYIN